jgi:pSer/pThr/pTyr-binding forkhead associated (FHA) protein
MLCVSLVLERDKRELRRVQLRRPRTVVGRQSGCHVRIPSAEVSRQHCELHVGENDLYVEDLNSVNGTYINDVAVIGKQRLNPGDRLLVGPLLFVVEFAPVPKDFELDLPRLAPKESPPRPSQPASMPPKTPAVQRPDGDDYFLGEYIGRGERHKQGERLEEVEGEDYVEAFEEVEELEVLEEHPENAIEDVEIVLDEDEPLMLPKSSELRGLVDGLTESDHSTKPGKPRS